MTTPATLPGGEDAATIRMARVRIEEIVRSGEKYQGDVIIQCEKIDAALSRLLAAAPEPPLDRESPKEWRCFFCDEVFDNLTEAAKHFGRDDSCEADAPACKLAAHEGHLVTYIRKLEEEIRRYQLEDSDVMRSIQSLEADHRSALRREEERGYEKGLNDGRALNSSPFLEKMAKALEAFLEVAFRYPTTVGPNGEPIDLEDEIFLECCGFTLGAITVADVERAAAVLAKFRARESAP